MVCMTETAVPGLRERKKQQTRDAIIGAALDLFERQGYDATTVEEIAEAADISPRTFFRYFDSKVDVVMDKDERDSDDFAGRLAIRPPHEGPIEAMRQVISAELGQVVKENPLFVRQMRLMLRTPSLHALARSTSTSTRPRSSTTWPNDSTCPRRTCGSTSSPPRSATPSGPWSAGGSTRTAHPSASPR